MKAKMVTALLAGIFLGFGMAFPVRLPDAKAQQAAATPRVRPLEYEFKVVDFPSTGDSEKKFIELATKRWEYIGVIYSGGGSPTLVAFRRLKK